MFVLLIKKSQQPCLIYSSFPEKKYLDKAIAAIRGKMSNVQQYQYFFNVVRLGSEFENNESENWQHFVLNSYFLSLDFTEM
jgi:hypothetical protein